MKKQVPKKIKGCEICGKNTFVKSGWHLFRDGSLNFCSNECVARFIEDLEYILKKNKLVRES